MTAGDDVADNDKFKRVVVGGGAFLGIEAATKTYCRRRTVKRRKRSSGSGKSRV
jgi:hypothetical protein